MLAQRLATPEQVEYATHVPPRKAPLHIPSPSRPPPRPSHRVGPRPPTRPPQSRRGLWRWWGPPPPAGLVGRGRSTLTTADKVSPGGYGASPDRGTAGDRMGAWENGFRTGS